MRTGSPGGGDDEKNPARQSERKVAAGQKEIAYLMRDIMQTTETMSTGAGDRERWHLLHSIGGTETSVSH